jgi:hypothetical protein
MAQTLNKTILPLDLNSIIQLLDSPGGVYAPLTYRMVQPSPNTTQFHLNIEFCDPDSIYINIKNDHVYIRANATVSVQLSSNHPTTLTRPVSATIPLPPGFSSSMIHSSIDENCLVITIPM